MSGIEVFGQLEIETTAHGIALGVPGENTRRVESTAEALRAFVRTDDLGRYRPLSGAKTLPRGWEVAAGEELTLEAALEVVYPLAKVHQRQRVAGELRVVALDHVLSRQSGRYEDTGALSLEGRGRAIATVCGECVRRPVWNAEPCGPDEIPCPEACSVLVAFCREAAIWQASPPAPAPPDPLLAWAAFDEPGNELRERYLSAMIDRND